MNDLEEQLSRLPLRMPPAEWRAQILRQARAAAPAPTWWNALAFQPMALAAAWVIIGTLWAVTPDDKGSQAQPAAAAVAWLAQRQALLVESARPAHSRPPQTPVPEQIDSRPHSAI